MSNIWKPVFCFLFSNFAQDICRNPTTPRECPVPPPFGEFWNQSVVNYYEEIINENTEAALHYQLPTDNSYFLAGNNAQANNATDIGEFDFIIVGAGTSGSTLAYELTNVENWKVLILEAGSNETDFSLIPSFNNYLQASRFNWGYNTTTQKHACRGMKNNQCMYPRGKSIGGTGAINALMYVRGNKEDYDNWYDMGLPGWSYKDVLPIFIEQEHSQINGDAGYHGASGFINVAYPRPDNPLLQNYLEAGQAAGMKMVDYNGREQLGYGKTQFSIINGRRESAGGVFLSRALCRTNLVVNREALVTRVLVNEKKAYGVEFLRNGSYYTAKAKKEVIVSGGAINTPQLLMLSGIGPKSELESLDIKVIQDLPEVGKNLRDHPTFFGLAFSTNFTLESNTQEELAGMYLAGYGPYTNPGNAVGIAFLKTPSSTLPKGVPDIQLIFVPPNCTESITPIQMNANEETTNKYWSKIKPNSSFRIFIMVLHTKATGNVTLTSNSPLQFPAIDTNYLGSEQDRETMYQGLLAALKIAESEPFKRIDANYIPTNVSACGGYEYLSKDYWMCNIEQFTANMYHPSSTAAMGTVVDHLLKVKGIGNLRVVDTSIFPTSTSGNTNAPAFMTALKASKMIKQEYLK